MTKLMTTPRLAALAAMSLASGTTVDLCAASTRRHAKFGTDDSSANLLNIKAEVSPHAGGAGSMAALTTAQVNTDIAGGCAVKKARTSKFNGLGSSANGTCIVIDGTGSASAPAKKVTSIGEARGAFIGEAGVDFGGSSCGQGKAPMALVAAASAKKASGSARCQV